MIILPFMRHFLYSIELSNLIEGVNTWRETTMEAEDLALNNGSQGKVIEKLSELFPHISISILSQTLVIETIPKPQTYKTIDRRC